MSNTDLRIARANAALHELRRRMKRELRRDAHVPAARCPGCGAAPPVSISRSERRSYQDKDPAQVVAYVRCGSVQGDDGRCTVIYPITAGAYARASRHGLADGRTRTWFPEGEPPKTA